jgi:hypothetical protein
VVKGHANEALLTCWRAQYRILTIGVQCAESFRIAAGVNRIDESQVSEIIDVNSRLKNHHDSIRQSAQLSSVQYSTVQYSKQGVKLK